MEFTFPRGFGHFQTRLSLCAAILTEINSRENLPQLTLRSLGYHDLNNFCNLSRLILEKGGSTSVLATRKKRKFLIEKSILGWKSTTGDAAFQSNFKFWVRDTSTFFYLRATNGYVTLWNRRLFTHWIISSEFVSRWRFSFESSNENTAFG